MTTRDDIHSIIIRFAGALVANSLDAALQHLATLPNIANIFVIGGGAVYADAMAHPQCAAIHLTQLDVGDIACDTHLGVVDTQRFRLWSDSSPRCEIDRVSGRRLRYGVQVWTPVGVEPVLPPGVLSQHEEFQVCVVEGGVYWGWCVEGGVLVEWWW